MLRDVSSIDTKTCIQGQEITFPVCVGATGMHRMAHSEGELATAKGIIIMGGSCGVFSAGGRIASGCLSLSLVLKQGTPSFALCRRSLAYIRSYAV